ncbi:MAG: hypothetical protein HOJ03_06615 [Nitrospina sp.]|nr:hypothetical protein [Nitrospina sp.]MBT4048820.1 hypothetical protein [Nitrospina sp.]MBT5347155.1 hypothetical protein [Nitrospina sp.]MBT5652153.1 hypothetical protein [Nitrospina sp.]MBT6247903.1 hypothetical protein [Nitrospina sp.]
MRANESYHALGESGNSLLATVKYSLISRTNFLLAERATVHRVQRQAGW